MELLFFFPRQWPPAIADEVALYHAREEMLELTEAWSFAGRLATQQGRSGRYIKKHTMGPEISNADYAI